ncbi:MAG: hypothetical protein C4294_04195 [Nitrospiraceae bacterium]
MRGIGTGPSIRMAATRIIPYCTCDEAERMPPQKNISDLKGFVRLTKQCTKMFQRDIQWQAFSV